jgi:hypothetical protein
MVKQRVTAGGPEGEPPDGYARVFGRKIKPPPPPPTLAKDLVARWLPTQGFTLQESPRPGMGYGAGYWVEDTRGCSDYSDGDEWSRAAIHYRGPDKEALAKVAAVCEEQGIEYDWDYLGRWKSLALVVTVSDTLTEAVDRAAAAPLGERPFRKSEKEEDA